MTHTNSGVSGVRFSFAKDLTSYGIYATLDSEVSGMAELVLRGRGTLARLQDMMDGLKMRRPLVVAGDRLYGAMKAQTGLALPQFSGYHPNPDFADCAAGAAMYRAHACDGLISLGGGSAMDTAKGIKAMLLAGGAEEALTYAFSKERIPHIAIPATAGTGAEATQFAVVYLQGMKHSLSHPALLPEGVLLDAALLDTLPDYHKRSCAMDALCQGIESWWATGATDDSRVHAEAAIRGTLDNILPYLAGDKAAAEGMMQASYRSGEAIQISRTTAAHAMSYRLTHHFGIAHGHACAVTLPVLWELLLQDEAQASTVRGLSRAMGLADPAQGPRLFRGLMLTIGLDAPLLPSSAVLDDLASSVNAERLGNHPQRLTQEMLRQVYVRAMTPLSEAERLACLKAWNDYARA